MSYSVQNIRNVCLLGHSGSGKTSLAESLLFMTGAIDRMGRVADGNTVCDYDPEEVKRQISLSTAVAPIDYKGCRINVLDTPGAFDFSGEVMEALRAADAAIIVASAKDGVSVGVEKAWKYCEERNMPRFIYISKIDEDHSDYNATFDALRERFGNKIAPVVVPTLDENKKVTGLMDILNKRAYEMQDGKRVEVELPEEKVAVINEFNDALKESVAETSEEFMERFFNGEDFTYAEMAQGLRQGVRELSVFPVLCGSAVADMGTLMLLDNIMELLPSPEQGNYHKATLADGTTEEFVVSAGGVPTAFVFKTISDQYGKYSFVKVLSGSITPDMTMVNARTGDNEKLGRLYTMRGKKATEVKELVCGDIGAIAKMDKVKTGDTLCDSRKVVALKGIPFAEPCYSVAIAPKTRGQDDKVAQGLNRLNEEDPSFSVVNNAETHQMVLSGAGDMQVDVLVNNAGILPKFKRFDRYSDEEIERAININFYSCVYSVKTFLPMLLQSTDPGIVNIDSSAALMSLAGTSMYSASKAALKGFTEALREEFRGKCYVGLVCPGFTKTDIFRGQSNAGGKGEKVINMISTDCDLMVKMIMFGIEHKQALQIHGVDAHAMSVFGKLLPVNGSRLFSAVMKAADIDLFKEVFKDDAELAE